MEPTVSTQIIEVLNALCDKFGLAIDWTRENVLPYVQELMTHIVNYNIGMSLFWMSVSAVFVLGYFLTFKKLIKIYDDNNEGLAIFSWLFWIFGGILTICMVFVFIFGLHDLVTCLTFPEKVIFNTIQSML